MPAPIPTTVGAAGLVGAPAFAGPLLLQLTFCTVAASVLASHGAKTNKAPTKQINLELKNKLCHQQLFGTHVVEMQMHVHGNQCILAATARLQVQIVTGPSYAREPSRKPASALPVPDPVAIMPAPTPTTVGAAGLVGAPAFAGPLLLLLTLGKLPT